MDIAKSDLVLATAGREKGKLFFVVDIQDEYLLLADGKSRRLEDPKRKKCRHVQRAGAAPEELAAKHTSSQNNTNSQLRKAHALYRGHHPKQHHDGTTLWQNPT